MRFTGFARPPWISSSCPTSLVGSSSARSRLPAYGCSTLAVAYDVFFPRKPPSGFRSMSHRFLAGSILFLVRPPDGDRYSYVMRPLRYSINATLDGCCDPRAMFAADVLFGQVVENLEQPHALLFTLVT